MRDEAGEWTEARVEAVLRGLLVRAGWTWQEWFTWLASQERREREQGDRLGARRQRGARHDGDGRGTRSTGRRAEG